ncbi:MAG: S9 family peptidase [Massilibacteroides sp.]|nr:S9 family peptidase [Massilibacteroides sp.]MDD4114536.1 S9 family peptidase [Massilibacteroides sp.]MDD4659227.1 S9 family peptidase [Massilibacteroides sp.]
MNKSIGAMIMATSLLLGACTQEEKKQEPAVPLIGRADIKVPNGVITPEVLHSMARVSDAKISPDAKKVLYGVTFMSIEQNKGNRELFVMNIDGSNKKQITSTPKSEQNAVWIKGGTEIAFLSSESGNSQIWVMNADGSNRRKVSDHKGGINGFLFSPDENNVLYFSDIKYGQRTSDIYPDLPKATGRIVDDLMYKHWDEWVETIPHPFISPFDGQTMKSGIDIMEGEPYECPMKPFSGIEDFAWSPNGKLLAYASRKKTGLEYSISTNSDIYLYNTETKKTINLTEGMMGYDIMPAFSPDGKYIGWISQERDGYESDKKRLFIADLRTGEKQYLTKDFDYNTDAFQWNASSQSLYYIACKEAVTHIWEMGLDRKIRQITSGQYDYVDLDIVGDAMVALRQSMESPTEVFHVNIQNGEAKEISFENKAIKDQLTMGKCEPRWIKTTDNKKMLTWIIYPPHFDPNKKYPALLYCQGGPQSTVSQFWSFRWNMQMMAANDYIVVAPNRRGLPGFGQEWLEQISGDYGGQNMKDYFAAIDEMAKEPYVDADHLGAVGASYGGFSVYWLAGHHEKRFKAFIAHAGIFNLEQQYLETEEMWFANWDMGGAYWNKSNKIAQKTFATSPHLFVDKWDTPILVTHGELDYRILASQGMSAFNAAKLRGIPTKMLIFPDENHWIAQPQNGILFQRVFFDWLDKWLKK